MISRTFRALLVCAAVFVALTTAPHADNVAQTLPFSQNWANTGLITVDDNWTGVPGLAGYRGDGLAAATGVDPQTIVADGSAVTDVNANLTNPNTFTTGGVAEFQISNPVVALQGSGTARAPNLVITVSTLGKSNIQVSYNLRDVDGSADNSVQPVALQYRIGASGNYTNVPAGFVADASSGPSLATLVTPVTASLPAAAADQPVVQIRILTTDAVGSDEWIGVDDISVTASDIQIDTAPTVTTTNPAHAAGNVAVNANLVINFSESVGATSTAFAVECPAGSPQAFAQSGGPGSSFTLTPAASLPYSTVCTVTVTADQVTDTDATDPPNEMAANFTFSFTTANPPQPVATNVIINEIDADTPDSDVAEFVELFDGGAGHTSLDGLVLVFYNGNGGASYAAFDLDGFVTDANGYFTLGNAGVPGVDLVFGPNVLQNGEDAVALYAGNAADFPNGTALTTANLQDAVVYDTSDPDEPALLALLNTGQSQVNESGGGFPATQSSQRCPNGTGGARNTSTYAPGTPSPDGTNTCVPPPTASNSVIVISQLYGGGGNGGAAYQNDYVELYNRGTSPVDIGGWSLQYASATGSGWDFNRQPLGGTIGPGEYYLISLASSGTEGAALPPANIAGLINMSGTNGKVALVNSFDPLAGNCPASDPHLMDLVGYGNADCHEGATAAPAASVTSALFRLGGGSTDTDRNGSDFVTGAASPRRTAPIVELGPRVLATDPGANRTTAPRDATIAITFTEPVDVLGAWFDILCAASGQHNSATFAGGGQVHYITPNVNFLAGELCTVTLFKDRISDQDLDDGPDTDTLPANFSWSFTVATGTAPPYPPSVHLTMGNPSGATDSLGQPNNYLMEKPEFALSYNRDLGRPNWVSWHLSDEWIGSLTRVDTFRPDPAVPADWYRVQAFDFSNSGFDRGHMVPNADRDKETSIPINQATFLMSNMVAQAPDNNQGPWAELEGYLRTLLPAEEIYVVAGGTGTGGSGSNGGTTTTLADGHVTVPSHTWKVALVLAKDSGNDVSRVTCSARTIAVILPNTNGIRSAPWESFLTTVDAVEALTGYDLFSSLPEPIQRCVEAGTNGNNPALVKGDQTITFAAMADRTYGDPPFTVSATGGSSGNPVTFTASGACTAGGSSGATITIAAAGACVINASQAGSDLYNPGAATVTIAIAKATPAFSAIAAPVIEAGTLTTSLSGRLTFGSLVPTGSVSVTLNGATNSAPINPDGTFAATFASASLSPAVYVTGFSYAGDGNFTGAVTPGAMTVIDTTAPTLTGLSATPDVLGPVNHKMIAVTLAYAATDITGAPVCSVSIASNEPVNASDDGNTSTDWQVIDPHHLQLRAERSGIGTGRVYTITVTCADGFGNQTVGTTTVAVPK